MKNIISTEEKSNIDDKLEKIYINLINREYSRISSLYLVEYNNLIEDNIEKPENITYIIHSISKEIMSLEGIENKLKILYLLKEFYSTLNSNNIESEKYLLKYHLYCKYISRILTVIQNNLYYDFPPENISKIFGKIVSYLFSKNIIKEEAKRAKKTFEILQGFCFYNMKQNSYNYQINGVLCLKELISNTEYYIKHKKLLKNLFEKIILFLDNNNFEPKIVLFELLSVFIKKCEKCFEPYINITLYKILNYIEENDVNLKRKIVDVFVLIVTDYPYSFLNITNSIINYLNLIIKHNNDSYIKNKCQEALLFYNNFNLYSTIDNFKKKEKNQDLFKTSKSSFYKTNNRKSDSPISKSTKYTTSKKYIKESGNKLNNTEEFHKKIRNRNSTIFSYSSKFNIWKSNYNSSRSFRTNYKTINKNKLYKTNTMEERGKDSIFTYAYSSLNKIGKKFRNSIKIKK